MNKNNIITGIDVGTTKIVVAVAEKKDETINIIGIGTSNSDGLNKGIVIDIEKTVNSIDKAIHEAEEESNTDIDSAYVGIQEKILKV